MFTAEEIEQLGLPHEDALDELVERCFGNPSAVVYADNYVGGSGGSGPTNDFTCVCVYCAMNYAVDACVVPHHDQVFCTQIATPP